MIMVGLGCDPYVW